MLGAAAAGAGGLTAGLAHGSEPTEEFDLSDAAAPPEGVRLGTRQLVWNAETVEPLATLTFDDGPDPELTPRILDTLDRFDVRASFHVMGYNAVENPGLLREIVARGHEIGSHTWSHPNLRTQTPEETERQLTLCADVIRSVTGRPVRYFRPPYGILTGPAARQAASMGYDVVLWSLGRGVPGEGTPRDVADHVVGNLRPGDIILLHDGIGTETFDDLDGRGPVRRRRDVEVDALPEIIERSLEAGTRFTTLEELLWTPRGNPA